MNLHTQMTTPYVEAFFKMLDKVNWHSLFNQQQTVLEPFDYICLMLRFLPTAELQKSLESAMHHGVAEGRLEALVLCGLSSKLVLPLIQTYVDRTCDLQTAAYVSAYAIDVQ